MQLLPNLKPYVALLEAQMGSAPGVPPQRDEFRRQEASRCYGALLAASAGAMYNRITQRCACTPREVRVQNHVPLDLLPSQLTMAIS